MTQRSTDFGQFTNQYALSKTLRFELKPIGNTAKMLEDAQVFQKDKLIQQKYKATKPYFDRLHREFIQEALVSATLPSLASYLGIFRRWRNEKDKNAKAVDLKELQNKEKELRKEVVEYFNAQAKVWAEKYQGLKNKDIGILDEEAVFAALLKMRYGTEEGAEIVDETTGNTISIFDSWKGFTGYFTKFWETRRNLYKDDGTATALATRIIDQNLKRFCDNILIFESVKEEVDFSEIEQALHRKLGEIFAVGFYNTCLLQNGIDFYNRVLGGEVLENGEKQKGLNECINKYRQDNKGEKIPFFKLLDKQIISEKEALIDEIKNTEELLESIKTFHESAETKIKILKKLFDDLVHNKENHDLSQVYLSKEALNTITHRWMAEKEVFEEGMYDVLKKAKFVSASAKKKDGGYSFPDFIPLSFVQQALENMQNGKIWKDGYYRLPDLEEKNPGDQLLPIFEFEFYSLFEREITNSETNRKIKAGYNFFQRDLLHLLQDFKLNPETKAVIKDFADSVLNIYQMAKYFAVEKKRTWNTDYELDVFYTDPENGYLLFYDNAYEEIVQVYNKLRNYLTKKPYSEEKWKLNFDNANLLAGWPDSPKGNTQYCSFIFRKNTEFYLGITDYPKLFDQDRYPEAYQRDNEGFEKMVYKQVDAKTLYGSVYRGLFGSKYSEDQKVMNDDELIRRIKKVLETRVEFFPEFQELISKIDDGKYEDAKSLAREISVGTFYNVTFVPVSGSYLSKGIYDVQKNKGGDIKKKNLYLFQIKNKDWNEGSIGTKNLHTLYFESLFSQENIAQNFPLKLNGQAEVFHRPKTEGLNKKEIVTKENKIVLHKAEKAFQRNRYTEDKIFFHVPLTLNRTKSDPYGFNAQINNFLANNPDINIIGVDRGEKHLAYYSVITQTGKILESGSLNKVTGVDYAKKLEEKAQNREQERKDWQAVEGIKDLKKGYISQVVRNLADLAIKYNAIIVLEDLNMRFKQIRGGIEKSVYQQLEKALIEKLNYLVDKHEKDPKTAGHLLRAYQLTAPFSTFKDLGKQTGIIFYTQAAYTSRIDPVTGWRPHLYLKYSSAEKAKKDILKFSNIEFTNGRFEFTYDVKKFRNQEEWPKNTIWTVCSNVERFRWNRKLNQNKGGYDYYANLTDGSLLNRELPDNEFSNFKDLFESVGIDITRNIKAQIEQLDMGKNVSFFSNLIFLFNLVCQIRNTNPDAEDNGNDFILSPVAPFFDSRKKNGANLPNNGDENGAYNIARKGIIILAKISRFVQEENTAAKMNWSDLYVSHTEWDNWARNHGGTIE